MPKQTRAVAASPIADRLREELAEMKQRDPGPETHEIEAKVEELQAALSAGFSPVVPPIVTEAAASENKE